MNLQPWSEAYGRTWLAVPDKVQALHHHVSRLLRGHRSLTDVDLMTLNAMTVDTGASQIGDLGTAGKWFLGSTWIALLGELLICARHGHATWPAPDDWEYHERPPFIILHALRNAVCHPAHHRMTVSGPPQMEKLADVLERNNEQKLAHDLRENWSVLARPEVTHLALRNLNAAGISILTRWARTSAANEATFPLVQRGRKK